MNRELFSRRNFIKGLGATSALTAASAYAQLPTQVPDKKPADVQADRIRRMQWWHQARFGMFIHGACTACSAGMNGSWKTRAFQ
jgi:alpha-L-fucosidase